ncbi:MAG: chromate transporter [Patescibacteria group bacterium]
MGELLHFFITMVLISALSFGGGAPALFYQFGVAETGWITSTDLTAVLAFGFATPGPAVFGTAAFIGYRLSGLDGALVGIVGVFVVPWGLAILAAKYLKAWLDHPHADYFIRGVGLSASGVVATTALNLMPPHIATHVWLLFIAAGAFMAVARWKVNPLYVLGVGGALGVFVR